MRIQVGRYPILSLLHPSMILMTQSAAPERLIAIIMWWRRHKKHSTCIFLNFRLGLNVALTHQNRSYRDSETKKTQRHRKGNREGETTGRGQLQLKINETKKVKKQLIFFWSLAYNMSDLSGPTRNMKVPADIACKINETHKPPTTTRC